MKFKSKVDWWMHICFASIPLISLWILVEFIKQPTNVGLIIGVVVFAICNVLILPWWWNMHYILDENELVVKLGGLGKGTRIPYEKITSIRETREPWSSAALSLDRIEIKYTIGAVYISPQNKKEFLRLLQEKLLEKERF